MVKQFQIGKSFITIIGKTIEEIEEKKNKYMGKVPEEKEISQEEKTVNRKRRTKAEIEADERAAAQSESTAETEAEED